MSTGETTPGISGRFTSPILNNSNINKKYPGAQKSPLLNNNMGGNRNSQTRQRLLSSKISAPRPINLPSLRRENATGTEVSSSPGSQHGWGSTNSSPLINKTEIKPVSPDQLSNEVIVKDIKTTPNLTDRSASPKIDHSQTNHTTRAWAIPSAGQDKVNNTPNEFPTAAEAANNKKTPTDDDKDYLKYATSDPNHTSWDEMVSEDLDDFSVDVIEFDDGTKVQIDAGSPKVDSVTTTPKPSYNEKPRYKNHEHSDHRGYRHHENSDHHGYKNHEHSDHHNGYKSHENSDHHNGYKSHEHSSHHTGYKPYRRSEDHGYQPRHNNENRRFNNSNNNDTEGGERRSSTSERWSRKENNGEYNKRSNYERKSDGFHSSNTYQSKTHQRLRRLSEHSSKSDREEVHQNDHNPLQIISEPTTSEQPEIIRVVQKNSMSTAAERLKKRLDEQEAEYQAAAERARQKAAALAAEAQKKDEEEHKTISNLENEDLTETTSPKIAKSIAPTTLPLPDISKPWNLVAAKKEEPKLTSVKNTTASSNEIINKAENTNSFVNTNAVENDHELKSPEIVEILDFAQNEELGTIPDHLMNGRRSGWARTEELTRGRGRGRGTITTGRGRGRGGSVRRTSVKSIDGWHQPEEPVVTEILKHEPIKREPKIVLSYRERLNQIQKELGSPVFPNFIADLIGKKPAHISFIVDDEESDKEITMMHVEQIENIEDTNLDEHIATETENASLSNLDEVTSTTSSMASTPSKNQAHQNNNKLDSSPHRMNMNPNFPVLVYQYPVAQQQSPEDANTQNNNGYNSRSKGFHHQQTRPMGVYLMPQQQYMANNQYMMPYTQTGTGQPIYFPPVSWSQQTQQPHYNNQSHSVRPHRHYNNNYEWRPNNYNRYNNNQPQRGTYRKRGTTNTWSNRPSNGRGRDGHNSYGRRYSSSHQSEEILSDQATPENADTVISSE